jgi:SAM-dependent methyltransferase
MRGKVLDAGAGRLAFKTLLTEKAEKYYSMDQYISRKELDIVADLKHIPINEKIFDTVVCLQVIEHSTSPETILNNLAASLKDGGILMLSAPHVSYLHGEPEDYYGFTKYGLKYLVEKRGLETLEIRTAASIFGFLFTPISDFILAYTYGIPFVFPIIFFLNSLMVRFISATDRLFFKNSLMPINYIIVAKKQGKSNEH